MSKKPRIVKSTLEFPYSRTVGPVVGAFLAGLREHRILGIRTRDGKVLVPPLEYDPNTGDDARRARRRRARRAPSSRGRGSTEPTPKHPLDRPFAFALVKPDGADTAMVHAVDAGSIDKMSTGHARAAALAGRAAQPDRRPRSAGSPHDAT